MTVVEATFFHPVAALDAIGDAPLAASLLETPVVLWRDGAGRVRAFADRCPHRGAALSLGTVHDGTLACAYHGWRFDGGGQCVAVPALPQWTPPAAYRACAYAVREAYGLAWVALRPEGPDDASALPAFEAEGDPRLRKFMSGPYDVATSAPRIVENFLDMAHFGYVHEGLLGARDHVAIEPYRVEKTATGFIAIECKAWQPQASLAAQGGAMIEYTYEVAAPYACVLTKVPEAERGGPRDAIALFVCPIEPERSRVWIRMAMADFESDVKSLVAFQDEIFGQDQPVVESQRPKRLPIGLDPTAAAELHSAADRSSTAYRRYLRELGITFGVC